MRIGQTFLFQICSVSFCSRNIYHSKIDANMTNFIEIRSWFLFQVCFNSSANFLIYYLNGQKFRSAWMETYGCWCQPGSNANANGIETHDDMGQMGKCGEDMLMMQNVPSPVTQITSSANGSRKIRREVIGWRYKKVKSRFMIQVQRKL